MKLQLIGCLVVLAGVGLLARSQRLTSGVVVKRGYAAAWEQTTFYPMQIGDMTLYTPQTIYWPETWTLTVQSGARTRTVNVTQSQHDAHPEGSRWQEN